LLSKLESDEERQSLRESIYEMLILVKVCLTSVWFWLPPLFGLFIIFELYLLCINPLLLLIAPSIMIVYGLAWEEKRTKAQYGLKELKVLKSSDPFFTVPRTVAVSLDVEKAVDEYTGLLKGHPTRDGKEEEKQE
jgi:hypothetical protein